MWTGLVKKIITSPVILPFSLTKVISKDHNYVRDTQHESSSHKMNKDDIVNKDSNITTTG